jgi:murein L,D-transpeptidase YafK
MGVQPFPAAALRRLILLGAAIFCLSACTESSIPKAVRPVPHAIVADMDRQDMAETSPIFIRLYKETSELEIWKQRRNGDYALLKTYQICKWSGALGPKKKEGDRQAPEGVYIVTPAQMNPNSHYYLSFNIGYPNAYDRSLGRTGSNLMVHGACSSAGCYSMTDEDAGEIFALARDSFRGGQTSFQIQALPFRMTAENLARHKDDPNMPFWRVLKAASDNFDLTLRPPKVDVCDRNYVFNADAGGATFDPDGKCPAYTIPQNLADALATKQAKDDAAFNVAVADLQAKEKEAADKAAEVAAREQQAAVREQERADRPSIIQRLFNRGGNQSEEGQATTVANAPPAAIPVTPKVVADVPLPRLRPNASPAPITVSAPVDGGAAQPAATEGTPPVGTFVKKPFLWPGDGDTVTGDGTSG